MMIVVFILFIVWIVREKKWKGSGKGGGKVEREAIKTPKRYYIIL